MFQYYLMLGLRSLRRNPVLTALMVLTLAIGVAASVCTLTILHMMSADPIPEKSARLFVPIIDNGPLDGYIPGSSIDESQMSYRDSMNLLALHLGTRRTAIYGISAILESPDPKLGLLQFSGLATGSDYFAMFEVPFKYGSGWTAADDQHAARVAVISQDTSEKLFGPGNPVGKHISLKQQDYQIVGVIGNWDPLPRYTHLINGNGGTFVGADEIYLPFQTAIAAHMQAVGSISCHGGSGDGFQGFLDSECTWIQFWIEARSVSDKTAIRDQLTAYTREQYKLGRIPRQAKNELFDVQEWMQYLHIVSNDNKLSTWLSFGFLGLCLVNTIGLLLAKFSARSSEVGVRRALGASRREIFKQFLSETAVLGVVGGVFGLALSCIGLWLIAHQSKQMTALAHMDGVMLVTTFVLAIAASMLAGILPAWRACQVTPALQLKSQ